MIEATLAQPGQHFITSYLHERDLLPGFREGMDRIAQDEQRHIAFGVKLLSDIAAPQPAVPPRGRGPAARGAPVHGLGAGAARVGPALHGGVRLQARGHRPWRERESLETKMRSAGLPMDELPGPPIFAYDLPAERRVENGLRLVQGGVLGEKTGPPGSDPETVAALFDLLGASLDHTKAPPEPGTIQWDFPDAEPWHLVVANGDTRMRAGPRRAADGHVPVPLRGLGGRVRRPGEPAACWPRAAACGRAATSAGCGARAGCSRSNRKAGSSGLDRLSVRDARREGRSHDVKGRIWGIMVAASLAALIALSATGTALAQTAPGISPPGANDWSCKPSTQQPHPVVLVHGTFGDMTVSWNLISPALALNGYCVFALDYGNRGIAPIEDSAMEVNTFVDRVLAATGASRVSLVGHSQGGMMARYYIKFLGGKSEVDDLVGLVPSNHGTTTPLAPVAGDLGCVACDQQVAGSSFLQNLNAGDETPGDVSYTQVTTRYDEVVTPYRSAYLSPGPRTTNVTLQDRCPLDLTEHLGIIYDAAALQWVTNALGRPGPAAPSFRPSCL